MPSSKTIHALVATLLLLVFSIAPVQAQDDPFARFPAISPDGQTIAFSYQGDIWRVPFNGGRSIRLTSHEAYDAHPLWSPDGETIGFTSERYGNRDLFTVSVEGSRPKRLTYHSTNDMLTGWTSNDKLLFTTERTFNQVEWEPEIYSVAVEGNTPDCLLDAFGFMPVMSPDGRFIVFVRGYNRKYRKHYRGPADKDLWIYDTHNDSYRELTDFEGNDMYPAFAGNRTLFFISERDSTYNIYQANLSSEGVFKEEPHQVTHLQDNGVRHFGVDENGTRIAFESETGLYSLKLSDGSPQKLDIKVSEDYHFYDVERKRFTDNVSSFAISPNKKLMAFTIRGELFVKKNDKDHRRSVQLTDHPYRDRQVAFLNDTTLIFTSDRHGQYDIFKLTSSDESRSNIYKSLKHQITRLTNTPESEENLHLSPDREKIAYQRGRGELVVRSITENQNLGSETILLDGWAEPEDISWSPGGQWVAYAKADLDFNVEVYIQKWDGSMDPVNVSKHPRPDTEPVWSPDGTKLAFLSSRNNRDEDVWFVWLREEDWQRTQLEWEERDSVGTKADTAVEKPIEIDFENLYERMQQVTSLPGNESDIAISEDGETFYFVTNRDGWRNYNAEMDLHKIQWDGSKLRRLTEGGESPRNVHFGPGYKYLYMKKNGGQIARMEASKEKLSLLPFRATMEIDHPKERKQMFEEAWRVLNNGFYDPDFHGHSWNSLHDKYKPWALKASTKQDFQDVVNMMLGELNASHMGFYSGDRAETQHARTGKLGVELDPVENGVEVRRVIPRSPADREISKLYEGDVIRAVNGTLVEEVDNFYQLLSDRVEEPILLTVENAKGETREVQIEPTGSLNRELYREWVDKRKRLTHKYSDGQLGYIHIQGMNWRSFERFERELIASGEGKKGIVIDVRYNGGGWTTDYLLTVLGVRQHAYTIPRGATDDLSENKYNFRNHYPYGERLPFSSWTRPSIALCNQNSYSNAEIFSHAYKNLDLGTLVGEPTFGAVISTGGKRLIDGSYVRLPFRGWYVKKTNQNMENGPAIPDVEVNNRPDYRGEGGDAQLKSAVERLMKQLDDE